MRTAKIERKTKETEISVFLNIDGSGEGEVDTGISFFDHMLITFAKHGRFDLKIKARGDNEHHIVEDVAICLSKAFKEALGNKLGIRRFGYAAVPMDDVLVLTAVDISNRAYFKSNLNFWKEKIEDMSSEMILHFLSTFANETKINLHVKVLEDGNEHHKAEAIFKSLALSIKMACEIVGKGIPSTKGVL